MKDFKLYEVGGKIRDELLGRASKDVDYTVVPSDHLIDQFISAKRIFQIMLTQLKLAGFEIFLVTENCYTIRAKFPKGHEYTGVADFVMARKEIGYYPNTRTPIVVPGSLYDDLSRRDFTINALAKDPDTGEIIDYFNGLKHIEKGILKTPLDPIKTFDDDPLRILRGIRFSITKGFDLGKEEMDAIISYDYSKMKVVSQDRIYEELMKCCKYDFILTIGVLSHVYHGLYDYIKYNTKIWFKPTTELK